jgi:NADH-quinone oxidoreductase subunit F
MSGLSNDLVDRVAAAGLRGRGGGWFPVARKWRAVRVEGGAPVVIANGGEGEPGSIKDRVVMTRRPSDVLAGLALAAEAVGAREALVYLKGSHVAAADALERAARGSGVKVVRGDDSYIGGEETALLEHLEGRRAWPRAKPPLPAAVGLHGRPTLVQNVDTLARVPAAVADPETYRRGETAWVSLWGHVRRPGAYEVPLGTPLRRLIDDWGGGAPDGIALIFPAGASAAPLGAEHADTPLDPDRLRERDSALGTAAVLVVGHSTCPLTVAASLARFFAREACGQCPPCVVGTAGLARIVSAVEAGSARPRELVDLAETAGFMSRHGYCAHARTAAASVSGLLARVGEAVDAHLRAGRCPHPNGAGPFDPGSAELQAIEALA